MSSHDDYPTKSIKDAESMGRTQQGFEWTRYPWIVSFDTSRLRGYREMAGICVWVHFNGPNTGMCAVDEGTVWFMGDHGPFIAVVLDDKRLRILVKTLEAYGKPYEILPLQGLLELVASGSGATMTAPKRGGLG